MIRAEKRKNVLLERYYNPDLKEEFINTYNNGNTTKCTWNSIFLRSAPMEEIKGKDLSNFTYEEIERLLTSFRSASVQRLSVLLSILTSYTDFSISRNFSIDNQNHFREIQRKNLGNYIDKRKAEYTYLTENDVLKIVNTVESYRDKYIVLGLFYGLIGDEYEDLINLDESDLLGDNKIKITSTGEIREVDPYLYEIMEKAGSQYEITFANGKTWKFVGTNIYKSLTINNISQKVTKMVIKKRINKIRNALNMPLFGPKALVTSGFCSSVMKYAGDKMTIADAIKTPYVQELRVRYQMPKTDVNTVKILNEYYSFVKENKTKVLTLN